MFKIFLLVLFICLVNIFDDYMIKIVKILEFTLIIRILNNDGLIGCENFLVGK